MGRESESGLPIEPVYGPGDPPGFDPAAELGEPGWASAAVPAGPVAPTGAATAGAVPASAAAAATEAHRHAAVAPASRCRRTAGRCAFPKDSRMINYVW